MSGGPMVLENEYFYKEKAQTGAPRLPGAFATDRLVTDNRGGFSFDGHRLSSLYRAATLLVYWLTARYVSAFSLPKYSISTSTGVTAPGMGA